MYDLIVTVTDMWSKVLKQKIIKLTEEQFETFIQIGYYKQFSDFDINHHLPYYCNLNFKIVNSFGETILMEEINFPSTVLHNSNIFNRKVKIDHGRIHLSCIFKRNHFKICSMIMYKKYKLAHCPIYDFDQDFIEPEFLFHSI